MQGRKTHRDGEALSSNVAQAGDNIARALVTAAADPQAVTFEGLGLPNMKDNSYVVLVHDEGLVLAIDESTKTKTGFNILNGTGAQVANVVIIGDFDE